MTRRNFPPSDICNTMLLGSTYVYWFRNGAREIIPQWQIHEKCEECTPVTSVSQSVLREFICVYMSSKKNFV